MPEYIVHLDPRFGASIVLRDTETEENCYGNSMSTRRFFVLNSDDHEILNAYKYKNHKKFDLFKAQLSLECFFFRSYMLKCQQLLAF